MTVRVAVVGGGPSGWAAAVALRDPRWGDAFDVTVFERNGYFGGKCCTVDEAGRIAGGRPKGYEMGAAALVPDTWTNRDLQDLLARYGVRHRDVAESARRKYRFLWDGPLTASRGLGAMLQAPGQSLYAAAQFAWYLATIERPTWRLADAELRRSRALSNRFGRALNVAASFGMQGYGYVDTDDRWLAPPELYYHHYARWDVIKNPVHVVDTGMQGVWATVASTFPSGRAHLNAEVTAVERDGDAVWVTSPRGRERFDRLVVAVPLGPALRFMDFDAVEQELVSRVRVAHYATVLVRVEGLTDIGHFDLRTTADRQALGRVMFAYKRYPDSDWVTLNLVIPPGADWTDAQIVERAAADVAAHFGARVVDAATAHVRHWPDYFPHLGTEDLAGGWYQRFEETSQNRRRTLFVSSGLHMETVGASVGFATDAISRVAPGWLGP